MNADLTKRAQDLLKQIVAFDTTSSKPNLPLIHFIRDYLAEFGVTSEIVAGDAGKACLWATINGTTPTNKPGIVLAGHSDVVPVAGQNWTSDPFTLTERDGKLYGRGACDMKAFIACALAMVPELVKAKLAQPVHLAFTNDEETTMVGAATLADYLRGKGIVPAWVWIGEPTLLHIIDSHKGVAAYQTTFTGMPGHSSTPDKGLNAIEMAHDFMGLIRAVAADKRAQPFNPSRYEPPFSTFNLGIIRGGTAENIIAEHCEILWQTRAHPGDDLPAALAEIDRRAHDMLDARIARFAPRASFRTCTCFDIPPLLPTANNQAVAILGKLTGHKETEAVSFATEAGFFQRLGAPVVVCGPGSIDQAHKADEFVEISQLTACIDLIRQVLLCSGPDSHA